jgi:hypothetical protein
MLETQIIGHISFAICHFAIFGRVFSGESYSPDWVIKTKGRTIGDRNYGQLTTDH